MTGRLARRVIGGLLLLAVVLVGGTALRIWQVARSDDRTVSDAIIVLGSTQANGVPLPILRSRLAHAMELYQAGVASTIITVGGKQPDDAFTEAQAGRSYLLQQGIAEDSVIAVNSGQDTFGSVRAAAVHMRQLKLHSAVLVSDPWHVWRSEVMARDNGIEATVSPTRSGPIVQDRETEYLYIMRETAGLLFYRMTKSSADKPVWDYSI